MKIKHENNGDCKKCDEIFGHYIGFYQPLQDWFKDIQRRYPDAHISCAGRGRIDQEIYFQRKASRAHYGASSHNFNAAIDVFQLVNGIPVYAQEWFDIVIGSNLKYQKLTWYGAPNAPFPELAHIQFDDWKRYASMGMLKLVE